MDTRDIPALMGRPLSPADSPADRDPPTDAALTTLSGVEPFSLIYLQVVRVTSGTRFLARFVGTADKARSMQQPLFAVGLPGLQPIDLHLLPGWDEAIPPPDWFKEMLTPVGWSWKMLPSVVVREALLPELETAFQTRLRPVANG